MTINFTLYYALLLYKFTNVIDILIEIFIYSQSLDFNQCPSVWATIIALIFSEHLRPFRYIYIATHVK